MIAQAMGGTLDYVVLPAYFVGIMVFGLWFGRYTATTRDFFFGGQRFSWWLISFSCIATLVGIYVQDALANTGALMLMHQGFIMRFLSLKSVKDSRRMVVCWILVLTPLAAIATSCGGWIARALATNGELATEAEDSFVKAANFLCSPGVFGFVLAALTAALMSTAGSRNGLCVWCWNGWTFTRRI